MTIISIYSLVHQPSMASWGVGWIQKQTTRTTISYMCWLEQDSFQDSQSIFLRETIHLSSNWISIPISFHFRSYLCSDGKIPEILFWSLVAWSVGQLVRPLVDWSVADCSEQATYGNWPCLCFSCSAVFFFHLIVFASQ